MLLASLAAVIFLASCQTRLIYYPRSYDKTELKNMEQSGGRRLEVTTSQGQQVAFYLPPRVGPKKSPRFLWIVCAGNASVALDFLDETKKWDARFAYLFVDYPSYGLCEGSPNPARIEESLVKLTEKLKGELHWSDEEFRAHSGVLCHSLGSACGLIAMDRLHLQRGVLCSPFTSMTDMARRFLGWPICNTNRHRFDNVARLQTLYTRGDVRVLTFHGQNDGLIPIAMSRTLAAKFPNTVKLTEVPDCGHGEIVAKAAEEIGKAMCELAATPSR